MTDGHCVLVKPDKLKRGGVIRQDAFGIVYQAKMKKMMKEVFITLLCIQI